MLKHKQNALFFASEHRNQRRRCDHQCLEDQAGYKSAGNTASALFANVITQRNTEHIEKDHVLYLADEAGITADDQIEQYQQEQCHILDQIIKKLNGSGYASMSPTPRSANTHPK